MKPNQFENIHLLRGFAALSVVVYHVIEILPWKSFPMTPAPMLWFWVGWMGVDLFFVISGFVIALSAIRLLRAQPEAFARTFVRHRAARILPLHYLTMAVTIAFAGHALVAHPEFMKHLLTHVFMVHNIDPATHGSINGANWSVGTEAQFYFLVLLTIRWLAVVNPWRLLATGILIAWAYRATVVVAVGATDGGVAQLFVYSTQLVGMLDEFACGIFLARLVLDDGTTASAFPRFMRNPWFWVLGTLAVFGAMWSVYWRNAEYWNDWRMVTFFRTAFGLSFMFVVGTAVFVRIPDVLRRFVLPPFFYLGEISYGIYLWHVGVISGLKRLDVADPLTFLCATLAIVIALASMSWHLLEKPLIRRFR